MCVEAKTDMQGHKRSLFVVFFVPDRTEVTIICFEVSHEQCSKSMMISTASDSRPKSAS